MLVPQETPNIARLYDKDTLEFHCDWRLTIESCSESQSLRWVYTVNLVSSFLLAVIASWLLYRRLAINGYCLRDSTRSGFLRPRPIECFMVCLITFHTSSILVDVMMLTGSFTSAAIAEVIWELPWPAMYSAVTLYTIGIIGTTPQMHRLGSNTLRMPSQNIVDTFGTAFLFAPSLMCIGIAFISGYYADQGQVHLSAILIRVHYFLWAFWCSLLLILVTHFGWNLTSIINKHLVDFNHQCTGAIPTVLKTGLIKLRIVLMEIALALLFFAIGMTSYSCLREHILSSEKISIAFVAVWILIVPLLSFIGLLAVAINPFEDTSSSARRSTSMRMSSATGDFAKLCGERDRSGTLTSNPRRISQACSNDSSMNETECEQPAQIDVTDA